MILTNIDKIAVKFNNDFEIDEDVLRMIDEKHRKPTPEEIESQVVKKAENAVSEVSGLKKITSQIYENSALLRLKYTLDFNSGLISVNTMKITVKEADGNVTAC